MEDNEGQVKEEYEEEPEHNSHISSMSDDEPVRLHLQVFFRCTGFEHPQEILQNISAVY